jgi:methionyl-tRNA formyltransferase
MGLTAVYLGTPDFAVPTLRAMAQAGHAITAVYTQPDRPKGRGQQLAAPPVKLAALELGLPVLQPLKIRTETPPPADVYVVVGYGQIIPQRIIDIPRLGIINVHASLLPKYRGAAPIQWAIANGEAVTGVTTMRIDAGLDTGDMLLKAETPVDPDENAIELGARLADMGARLLIDTLDGLAHGSITPEPQDHAAATLAPILTKSDGHLNWTWPAHKLHNRIRGFQPWPGGLTLFRDQPLQICRTRPAGPTDLRPGELGVRGRTLEAGCGDGRALELIEVQQSGKKRVPAADFLNGARLAPAGEFLGEFLA